MVSLLTSIRYFLYRRGNISSPIVFVVVVIFEFEEEREREKEREMVPIMAASGEEGERPLGTIVDAFEGLAAVVGSSKSGGDGGGVEVALFLQACSHVSVLFGCLGIAFKFAEMDYVAKVEDLKDASKSIATLQSLLEQDIEPNRVKRAGGHSRKLSG